jgi:hypothetical protein
MARRKPLEELSPAYRKRIENYLKKHPGASRAEARGHKDELRRKQKGAAKKGEKRARKRRTFAEILGMKPEEWQKLAYATNKEHGKRASTELYRHLKDGLAQIRKTGHLAPHTLARLHNLMPPEIFYPQMRFLYEEAEIEGESVEKML